MSQSNAAKPDPQPPKENPPAARGPIFSVGFLYVAGTALGLATLLVLIVLQARHEVLPVAARVVDPPLTPAPVAVIEHPEEPNTNSYPVAAAEVVAPPSVKLQGIFFNPQNPSAILDGKTVYLGDRIPGGFRVLGITPTSVTIANPTGTNVLSLSGR